MRLATVSLAVLLTAAAQSDAPDAIRPGQWESVTQYRSLEAPGLPEETVAQLREAMLRPASEARCVTQADAASPLHRFLSGDEEVRRCSYQEILFAEGRIRLRGTCPGPEGTGQVRVTLVGRYSETSMASELVAEVDWPGSVVRMEGTVESRRVGECAAGE